MTNETIVTELIIDARGAEPGTELYVAAMGVAQRAVDRFHSSLERQIAASRDAGDAAAGSAQRLEASAGSWAKAERGLSAYLSQLDPVFAATQRLAAEQRQAEAALSALDRQMMRGGLTLEQFEERTGQVAERLGALKVMMHEAEQGNIGLTQSLQASKNAADQIRAAIDPLAAAWGNYEKKLAEVDLLNKQGLLTDRERAEAIRIEAAAHRDRIDALDGTAAAMREAAAAQKEAARAAQEYKDALDPLTAAWDRYEAKLAVIADLHARGELDGQQRIAAINMEAEAHRKQIAVLDGTAAAERLLAEAQKQFIAFAQPEAQALAALNEKRAEANRLLAAGRIAADVYRDGIAKISEAENAIRNPPTKDTGLAAATEAAKAYRAAIDPIGEALADYGRKRALIEEIERRGLLTTREIAEAIKLDTAAHRERIAVLDGSAQAARDAAAAQKLMADSVRDFLSYAQPEQAALDAIATRREKANALLREGAISQAAYAAGMARLNQEEAGAHGWTKAEQELNNYVSRLDPAFAAARRLQEEEVRVATAIETLNGQMIRGSGQTDQYAEHLALLKGRLDQIRAASTGLASGNMSAEQAFAVIGDRAQKIAPQINNATYALHQVGIQSIDVFQQLATGAPVMTTFIQQGGQLAQIAAWGGIGMTGLAKAVGGLLIAWAPLAAAVAGGAAIGLIGFQAERSARQMNTLQNELRATREDYKALAADAVAAGRAVAASSSLGTSDAVGAGGILAGASGFAGGRAELQALIRTAADLGAVMGKTAADGARDLADAMKEPGDAAKRLADNEFPGMSQSLAYLIQRQAQAGDAAGAFARYLEIVKHGTKDAAENVTPFQKALTELQNIFTGAGADGKTFAERFGVPIVNAVTDAVRAITKMVDMMDRFRQAIADLVPQKLIDTIMWIDEHLPQRRAINSIGNALSSIAPTSGPIPASHPSVVGDIQSAAARNNIDPRLLGILQGTEGVYDEKTGTWALSSSGRVGPMQVSRSTFAGMQRQPGNYPTVVGLDNLDDVSQNVQAGAAYFAHLLRKYGDVSLAVLAYHDGETVMDGVLQGQGDKTNSLDALKQARKVVDLYGSSNPITVGQNAAGGSVYGPESPSAAELATNRTLQQIRDRAARGLYGSGISQVEREQNMAEQQLALAGLLQAQKDGDQELSKKYIEHIIELRDKIADKVTQEDLYGPVAPAPEDLLKAQREAEIRDRALAGNAGSGILEMQIRANQQAQTRAQEGMRIAISDGDVEQVKNYAAELADLRGKMTDLITEQQKLARASEDAVKPLAAEVGWARTMAQVDQQFALAARAAGKAVDEEALARARLNKQRELATEFKDQVVQTDRETEAQLRVMAAYDGTSISLERAANWEKAYAQARKDFGPGDPNFLRHVQEYATALDRNTAAARQFQQAQASVQAVTDSLGNAMDRLGQGMVDAFLSGQGQAVNFGNVVKAVIASMVADFAKLAILNPLKNNLFGSTAPTLGSALSVFGGGGASGSGKELTTGAEGGQSLMSTASNVLSIGKLTDMFGLTNLSGSFSKLTSALGLGGSGGASAISSFASAGLSGGEVGLLNAAGVSAPTIGSSAAGGSGLLGGLSSGVQSVLSTPIYSSAGGFFPSFASSGLSGGEIGLLNAAGVSAPSAGAGAMTLGSILGPASIGFGLGQFGGGFVQNAMGKTGYGNTIGAGLGTAAGVALMPVLGPLAPIIGGLLGGAGGGLIGPNKPSLYSSTGIGVTDQGTLSLGKTYSQLADTAEEVKSLGNEIASLNQVLSSTGTKIANGASSDGTTNRLIDAATGKWLQIGQNTPDGTADPSKYSSLASAFPGLRFSVTGAGSEGANRVLQDKSFASGDEFTNFVSGFRTFMDETLPQLTAVLGEAGSNANEYQQQLDALNKSYSDAIVKAAEYGQETDKLSEAQVKAAQELTDSRNLQLDQIKAQLGADTTALQGGRAAIDAQLKQFDVKAEQSLKSLRSQLAALGATSEDTASLVALMTTNLANQRGGLDAALTKQQELADAYGETGTAISKFTSTFGASIEARLASVSGDPNRAAVIQFDQGARDQMEQLIQQLQSLNASSSEIESATGKLADAQQRERDSLTSQQALAAFSFQEDTKWGYAARLQRAQGNEYGASFSERQRANAIAADQISARLAQGGWDPSKINIMNTVQSALDAELATLTKSRDTSLAQFDVGLLTRGAKAANDNTVSTQLAIFDQNAKIELQATKDQLVALGLAAGDVEWRINSLVIAQNKERDAIKDQTDALNQQKRDQAESNVTNVIQQITQYAKSLQVGDASPFSARAQYDIASRQFDTGLAAARGGDFNALQNLTANAETLRNASRALSGSGLGYVQTFDRITQALESVAAMTPATLTAAAMAQIAQTNTQTMVAAISELKAALIQIRDSINRNAYAAPASRAA